jgi:hypothetical protein
MLRAEAMPSRRDQSCSAREATRTTVSGLWSRIARCGMERLLYIGLGGLLLGDGAAESFRHPYQVRAGLSLQCVQNLTAHCLLRRIGKKSKPKKGSMYAPRRTCAPLASPSQIPPNEAVQEHREYNQSGDDVGAIVLLGKGQDRECHPCDQGGHQ